MRATYGYAGTILSVDLSSRSIERIPLEEEMGRDYLGGHGINARLLHDLIKPGCNPLSPENVLIYGTGPLVGTMAPTASRATVMAKSPLTGFIGVSNAGHFGAMLKFAGYDNLILKGRADQPVYLEIDNEDVRIVDAAHLWGKDVSETTDALWHDIGDEYWVSCIGPAGENLVRFASIINNKHSAFGRTGMGAVMGSKNLKAVAVRGTKPVTVAHPGRFMKLVNENLREIFSRQEAIKMYRERGTLAMLLMSGFINYMPRPERDTEVFEVEKFQEQFQKFNIACSACPLGCKAWLQHREGMEFGVSCTAGSIGLPYGIELLMPTWTDIGRAADAGRRYGMDSIDLSATISWAMELYQDGIITKDDTDGLELKRGDVDGTLELMRRVAFREGLGDTLAEGLVRASQKVGRGSEAYAHHIKGLGKPRRFGLDLRAVLKHPYQFGSIINPRGWHPDAYQIVGIPFTADREATLEAVKKYAPAIGIPPAAMELILTGDVYNLPLFTKYVEEYYVTIHSLGVCVNPVVLMNIDALADLFSAATGIEASPADLRLAAERVWNVEKVFNLREGATRKDDRVPERFTRSSVELGVGTFPPVDPGEVRTLLDGYYEAHGWDRETGEPTRAKLEELGLEELASEFGSH